MKEGKSLATELQPIAKQTSQQLRRIYYWVSEYAGCAWYRCHVPGLELKRRGHFVTLGHILPVSAIGEYDIIVVQRQHSPEAFQFISYAHNLGKLVVYEIDDDFWHVDKMSPAHKYWSSPQRLRGVEACMSISDLVTTSTPFLAEYLSRYNKKVVVLPNMLPAEHWQINRKPREDERVIVGWAGSITHWSDLQILQGTVEQILDEYSHVEFHIAGMEKHPFKEHQRIKVLEPVKLEQYAQMLVRFDLGLAPLVDTHFNRCKSDLKFIEYSMAGLAVVASKVEPYEKAIVHGESGFLARNIKDWVKYLRRLIEDQDLRKKVADAGREYAEKRTIDSNISMWEKAYGLG